MTPAELRAKQEANRPEPEGVQFEPDGTLKDHPLEAIKFAEERGIAPDGTIINILTADEKMKLLKLIKHGEFNKKEGAFLKYLIYSSGADTHGNLEDIAAMLGAVTGKGEPTSKQYAFGRLEKIMTVIAKKLGKLKPGKTTADVVKWLDSVRKNMKAFEAWKAKKNKLEEKKQKEAMKEFWELFKGNNKLRREKGLPRQSLGDLQTVMDEFPNKDGSRGLKTPQGDLAHIPVQSIRYHGGSDQVDNDRKNYDDDSSSED